ncbi:MAG TPA: hypothetical protein VGD37_00730 [Kofleriaceae bacterium]|jgi:hypothetical protein
MTALRAALVAAGCLAGCLAASLGACGGKPAAPGAPDHPAPITEPADSCTTADDCDLVDACCGCNAGGKRIAIRKDAVAGFQASREQRCTEVMCAQMISTDPSCDAEAICGSRNRCRVAPHMQHQ